VLKVLVDQLPHQARHMLNYGYWGSPGMRSAARFASRKAARSRFYYELDKVHAKLLGSKPKDPGHSEEAD